MQLGHNNLGGFMKRLILTALLVFGPYVAAENANPVRGSVILNEEGKLQCFYDGKEVPCSFAWLSNGTCVLVNNETREMYTGVVGLSHRYCMNAPID
jgi:hypothetical protein